MVDGAFSNYAYAPPPLPPSLFLLPIEAKRVECGREGCNGSGRFPVAASSRPSQSLPPAPLILPGTTIKPCQLRNCSLPPILISVSLP
jgi:hypothetical protein